MKNFFIIATSLFLVVWSSKINAQEVPDYKKGTIPEVGIYEHLNDTIPDGIFLYDLDSNRVNVKDLIDKPTIFSFVFYNCPGLCPALLSGLTTAIEKADMELGKDYNVITISFDPDDRPSLGIKKKANYVASIKKPIDASKWYWLTGDSINIHKITDALGFKYKRGIRGFLHPAAIMVVSPKGKITRYLNGTFYLPFDVKMAVVEANDGKARPTITRVLRYCFSYDPKGKKYVFNITKITGTVILSGAFLLLLVLSIKGKKADENQERKS